MRSGGFGRALVAGLALCAVAAGAIGCRAGRSFVRVTVDADEMLSEGAGTAIKRAICRPQFGAYYIDIVNFTDDRIGGDEFVHNAVRLFRKVPGVQFSEPIHEQVIQSIQAIGLPWARLEGLKILHTGYRPSVIDAKDKNTRTISMLRDVVADRVLPTADARGIGLVQTTSRRRNSQSKVSSYWSVLRLRGLKA